MKIDIYKQTPIDQRLGVIIGLYFGPEFIYNSLLLGNQLTKKDVLYEIDYQKEKLINGDIDFLMLPYSWDPKQCDEDFEFVKKNWPSKKRIKKQKEKEDKYFEDSNPGITNKKNN